MNGNSASLINNNSNAKQTPPVTRSWNIEHVYNSTGATFCDKNNHILSFYDLFSYRLYQNIHFINLVRFSNISNNANPNKNKLDARQHKWFMVDTNCMCKRATYLSFHLLGFAIRRYFRCYMLLTLLLVDGQN